MKLIRNTRLLNFMDAFPLYAPFSGLAYKAQTDCTIQAIRETIPNMKLLVDTSGGSRLIEISSRDFCESDEDLEAALELKTLLDQYGSDKSIQHDYHYIYGPILRRSRANRGVFEVGLGSTNPEILCNMDFHPNAKPGGSLRAFRDFTELPVYGADIDKDVLFDEPGIRTFFLDQTDANSFDRLKEVIPAELDLVVDDGLHAPHANVATLAFGLGRIKPGGWVVIEDLGPASTPLWHIIAAILPPHYKCYYIHALNARVFAVHAIELLEPIPKPHDFGK